MNPILFKATAKSFDNNGIGILSDAAFCEVTEERNGAFELVLDYPMSGIHFNKIEHRSIIFAKPNQTADAQPFRVYRITKPINGMVTVYAKHISYDLSGIAVTPFEAGSAAAALQALKSNSVGENPFEFWTDKSTVATMNVKTPASVRAMLGGVAGSVLDTYGGEYEFDGYTVKLYNKRGENRGVSVRYGKNLTDLTQEENCANVYTAVLPFWADMDGNMVMLDEKTVPVEGTFDFERVFVLDFSNEFDNQPTKEEIRTKAENYIKNNKIGVPSVSIKLSFVQLEQTEEYKNKALLEQINLCDEVNVVFDKLGVSATAQVIKTVYNVLLNRYESVELGDAKSNLADTIVKQDQAIKDAPKQAVSMAAKAAENATQLITGNRGGYVVIHSSTGASEPDEILIMDTPSIETARKVWRWNNSGLGYSETGYSGTYTTAWTIDGAFNADFITAGTISANLIKSGLLQSLNGMTSFDMDSGKMKINMTDQIYMLLSNMGIEYVQNGKVVHKFTGLECLSYYVNCNYFSVLDENDSQMVRVGSSSNGGSIDLRNKAGKSKADISADEKGGSLTIRRSPTETTTAPTLEISGDDDYGGVVKIYNNEGNVVAQMANNSSNLGGYFRANNAEGVERATMWIDSNYNGILSLKNSNNITFAQLQNTVGSGGQFELCAERGATIAQLKNKSGAGGQLELRNEKGQATFSFSNASGGGAECWIGQGEGTYKLFDYKNGINLYVDHITFYGKNNNLFVSGGLPTNECSAYVVYGQPTSGGYYSSIVIPSALAVGNTWQIADETNYIKFTINSSGTVSRTGGSSGSGSSLYVYSIR